MAIANGAAVIRSVAENLSPDDVELLLANRGLPTLGEPDELLERLQKALSDEVCGWEWEQQDVPDFHTEMVTAGATMVTHGNCLYVFGGMDDERQEQMRLWRWNLSAEEGFEAVSYRGQGHPPKLAAGHFSAVYRDELWVFPGPRSTQMRRVHCLNLLALRWSEKTVSGECPCDPNARRNVDCFLDGDRLVVLGGPRMDAMFVFSFISRTWSKLACSGGHATWTFGHAAKRGKSIFAFGTAVLSDAESPTEVWELSLPACNWRMVESKGKIPAFRIHCSSAVVADQWLIHGGRRPGRFNVTNQTHIFDFKTSRWRSLLAEGAVPIAREWHTALGLHDCAVVIGGREDIQEQELVAISNDSMATAVEILWIRNPPARHAPTGKAVMLSGIQNLLANQHLSDATIYVDGILIPVHRQVLAMHSRVFDRMWTHKNLQEAKTAEVIIREIEIPTVQCMLGYMYGKLRELPSTPEEVLDLFRAADKYDMPGLVTECMHAFRRITQAADVAPLLEVAYERDSEELRDVCLAVAAKCLPNIVVCASFEELVQRQPTLALNFVREVTVRHGMPYVSEPRPSAQPSAIASTDGLAPEATTSAAGLKSQQPSAATSAAASPIAKQPEQQLPSRASSAASLLAQPAQHLPAQAGDEPPDGDGRPGSPTAEDGLQAHADVSDRDSEELAVV